MNKQQSKTVSSAGSWRVNVEIKILRKRNHCSLFHCPVFKQGYTSVQPKHRPAHEFNWSKTVHITAYNHSNNTALKDKLNVGFILHLLQRKPDNELQCVLILKIMEST